MGIRLTLLVCLAGGLVTSAWASEPPPDRVSEVRKLFAQPPRDYSTAPLWVWNDRMTDEKVVRTLHDLASQGVKQVFVHPRPGLITPYLSDEWFRAWKTALRTAEQLDMNVWIYDENSYPSGFAGGLVPEALPDARGKRLNLKVVERPKPSDELLAVFRLNADGSYQSVTDAVRGGQVLPKGRYLQATVQLAPSTPWFAGKFYVDLMKPGVTEKFLEITLGAYEREVGDQFGKRVPGIFTDEPHLAPAGGFHWSDRLPQVFAQRWGYSLLDHLPCLVLQVGDWKKVRHDYYQLLLEQFIEHWSRPYHQWCERLGLELTGHYWEHAWPAANFGGDMLALYAWHQRPAIDILMNQYREDVHAQFGNVRAVLELASVANQLGRRRTLCETYGAGGWDLRFEDMKRIGDWVAVLGVNTIDEHLSFVTICGARKRDHPQSFSYHEPWWEAYHLVAQYLTRLCLVLSSGEQVNRVLVLEPTTTAWMYQSTPRMNQIGERFQRLVTQLAQNQVEFDIGSEYLLERFGRVEGPRLVVGQRAYDLVVLPEDVENLNSPTLRLLSEFVEHGQLWSCSPPPARVDGRSSDKGKELDRPGHFRRFKPEELVRELARRSFDGFSIRRADGDRGILYHQRRRLQDGQFVLLVNTSLDQPSRGTVTAPAADVEQWDLETGQIGPRRHSVVGQRVRVDFELPPCGSLLLFFKKGVPSARVSEEKRPRRAVERPAEMVAPAGPLQIRRLEPNVLTLDYVDVSAGGQTRRNVYFFQAARFVFQKHGLDGNPWERAVQFRDELLRKTFPPDSGFTASYRFVIRGRVPSRLYLVVERPDLYTVTCNGQPVKPLPGQWWLDRDFGKFDISKAVRVGENVCTLSASPMTVFHELEPVYVLGDFALEPTDSGFVLVPPRPLQIKKDQAHGTEPEGTMWLTTGIGYRHDAKAASGNDGRPYVVFDLGRPCRLRAIRVWNYNEVDRTGRGVRDVEIRAARPDRPDAFDVDLGQHRLWRARGDEMEFGQTISVQADGVRYVRFDIRSNHNGVRFPTKRSQPDNAFVGLSEVRFLAEDARTGKVAPVEGVQVKEVSSELRRGHDRVAQYLVDGSGLSVKSVGWNRQGCPFYGGPVAYTQTFDIDQPLGRYVVQWNSWLGSVAKVTVNGHLAGYVGWRPYECDVTRWLRPGRNTVSVVVVGTLRNTLGPHHAGPVRGAAWPNMFQRGPETGPPPGAEYHTLDYGLFEPFRLVRRLD